MSTEATVRDRSKLLELVELKNREALFEMASEFHHADLTELYENFGDSDDCAFLANSVGVEMFAKMLSVFPTNLVQDALEHFELNEQKQILEKLSDDDRVDVIQAIDEDKQELYLELLQRDKEKGTRDLMKYEEETAGGRMTRNFGRIRKDMTIKEALDVLQKDKDQTEMLARIYVVNYEGLLLGKVRLRELAFNSRDTVIEEVMTPVEATIMAHEDQELAAQLLQKYDMFAIPVVDEFDKLLGIITHDDIVEIIQEENTEDIQKLAGISGDSTEDTYLNTSLWTHFMRRVKVLFPLALLAIISGWAMWKFEDTLTVVFELAIYFPMVIAAGGNSGGQASTVVIRAMSIGEIQDGQVFKVIRKELFIGIIMGLSLGVGLFAVISSCLPIMGTTMVGDSISVYRFALTIGLALFMQVTVSTVCGATLPMIAKALKIDPALISSPAITTIVDLLGVVIYFTTAQVVLHG